MNHNLYRLYIIKASKWLMLYMPIVVLFYSENGLSMQDIFYVKSVGSISIILFSIPTGYFADVWGRRKTLIIGSMLGAIGYIGYATASTFWQFATSEAFLGMGVGFISGADSALLYESLKEAKQEKQYSKYEGYLISVGNFAEAVGALAGGFLASYSLRLPSICQAFIGLAAVPAAWSLIEPQHERRLDKGGFRAIGTIIQRSLFTRGPLRINLMLSSIIGCSTLTMAWFVQPYFKSIHLPIGWYGVCWTVLNLTVGLVSMYAYRIKLKLGHSLTVVLVSLVLNALYLLTGSLLNPWSLTFIYLFYIIRGIATPVLKDLINQATDSETRATVLSIRDLMIRAMFSIIGPILGWVTDKYTIQQALISSGGVFLLLSAIILLFYFKQTNKTEADKASIG